MWAHDGTRPRTSGPFQSFEAWSPRLLLADDVALNVQLLTRILNTAGYRDIHATTDGGAVLRTFESIRPDIVLLDLHMPNADGIEIVKSIRANGERGARVPVIVLTGDSSPDARRGCLQAGASDFIGKPYDAFEVVLRVKNLLETRRLQLELARDNERLEHRVKERTDELLAARLDVLQRLAIATEARDDDTGEHTRRVGALSGMLAEHLGLDAGVADVIRAVAPLHDIGKIAIPDHILKKPGRLTAAEYEVMQGHALAGAGILTGGDHELMITAERIALTHHERWDGSGYPNRLERAQIPIEGRITAVADFFDALTHDRVYRAAMPVDEVLEMIASNAGVLFDPDVARAMREIDLGVVV